MIDVPRADQERHLRAIVPEWLTRPPEQEVLRRQRLAYEAARAAELAGLARREVLDTVRAGALLALVAQFLITGFAPAPLAAAVALGVVLGYLVHLAGEGIPVWMAAGVAVGAVAAVWLGGVIALVTAPCAGALAGAVVGIVRDPAFRV